MLEPISFSLTRTFKIILIVMPVSLFQVQAGLEDLDWQSLASKLSSSGALLDASPAKFIDEYVLVTFSTLQLTTVRTMIWLQNHLDYA